MAKFPPAREKFVDVVPAPTDDQVFEALLASLGLLARHRRWARYPGRDPRLSRLSTEELAQLIADETQRLNLSARRSS
jgi:hypothetical protein